MTALPNSSTSLIKGFSFRDRSEQQIFSEPPILTSEGCGWDNVYLEYHNQTSTNTPRIYNSNHLIGVNLNPSAIEAQLNLNGEFNQTIYHQLGMVTVKPSGAYYQYSTAEANQFIMLELEPKFIDRLAADWVNPDVTRLIPVFSSEVDPLILQLALALKTELKSGCLGGKIYSDSIITALTAHLIRNYANFVPQLPKEYRGLAPKKLDNVIDYIQTYLELNLGIGELADLSGLSPFYFSRLFKESTGLTPYQYISRQRMKRAKQLLQTDLAIAEIALRCGFSSQSSFSTAFRKTVGVTPKVYRQQF